MNTLYTLLNEITDDLKKQLEDIMSEVHKMSVVNSVQTGIVAERTYTTNAFVEAESRFFKFSVRYSLFPYMMKQKVITEITADQYTEGIEAEKQNKDSTWGWEEIDV